MKKGGREEGCKKGRQAGLRNYFRIRKTEETCQLNVVYEPGLNWIVLEYRSYKRHYWQTGEI